MSHAVHYFLLSLELMVFGVFLNYFAFDKVLLLLHLQRLCWLLVSSCRMLRSSRTSSFRRAPAFRCALPIAYFLSPDFLFLLSHCTDMLRMSFWRHNSRKGFLQDFTGIVPFLSGLLVLRRSVRPVPFCGICMFF